MSRKYKVALAGSILLGLVFVISGVGKLLGNGAFLLSVSTSGILSAAFARMTATWLPWGELVLGVCLVVGVFNQFVTLFAAILAAALTFHNSWMISHGLGFRPCNCFGIFEKLFKVGLSSGNALYVDIVLLAVAMIAYFFSPVGFFNLRPWFWPRHKVVESAI